MAQEIERKFLITGDVFREFISHSVHVSQGYLNTDPLRTVRIRRTTSDDGAVLTMTIKGVSPDGGLSRPEFEQHWPCSESDQDALLGMCSNVIHKTRHVVYFSYDPNVPPMKVEVDVFHGDNDGLIVAEIEYGCVQDASTLPVPDWVGIEVTGEPRFYNSNLSTYPYNQWSEHEKSNTHSGCGKCSTCSCGVQQPTGIIATSR